MSHYDFLKAIVLAKVDLLGHGAPTQRESFAVQRGHPRTMSRIIKKRKDRSTCKKRQTRSAGSKDMQLSNQLINFQQQRIKWEPMLLLTVLALNRLE